MAAFLPTAGARVAEKAVLDSVEEFLRATPDLSRPLRIIVPSGTLRAHLSSRLVEHFQRPLVGVVVQTLWGAALEIHERCGEAPRRGDLLFAALVERLAREEEALRQPLEGLADGYRAVAGSVRDLLDAGLEPALAPAAEDILRSHGARANDREPAERGAALVRIAAGMDRVLAAVGLERSSTILRRARDLLRREPDALPARGLLIHGFADATGRAGDLLEALLQVGKDDESRRVIFDLPPGEAAFARPLLERLGGSGVAEGADVEATLPERLHRFTAAGTEVEVAEVARRLRRLLDGEAAPRPERIAVVARDLTAYRLPLARQLRRLGIPFSAYKTPGGRTTAGRAARALSELLERRGDLPTDRWLDARRIDVPRAMELRLALRAAGAARLRQAARLNVDRLLDARGRVPLPLRQGLMALEEDGESRSRAHRRTLDGRPLRRAVTAAQALVERLEDWPERDTADNHLNRLEALLREDLAWSEESPAVGPILEALAEARRQVPRVLELERREVRQLVSVMLREVGRGLLGGLGGGVQILTVTEARALTFEHLLLVGLNRDVFPRTVREDPLLPDALRMGLRGVLPDVPIKRRGFEEERYLFAQLLSAAPHITLSWQTEDDEGTARSPSPLVERLRWSLDLGEAVAASEDDGAFNVADLQPAEDRALTAALAGGRRALQPLYPAALREARHPLLVPDGPPRNGNAFRLNSDRLAAVRLRLLAEIDPDQPARDGQNRARTAGPYLGYLGPLAGAAVGDPRRRPLYVTLLERLAGCPWQTFITRLLGIEPISDPLQALPGIDRLVLGDAVHGVLEKILEEGLAEVAGTLEEALERDPVAVPWPQPLRLEMLLWQESERILRENAMPLPGLAQALARRVRPYLEVAHHLDFATPLEALGAEVEGAFSLTAAGQERRLHFRADRVDQQEGRVRLTDYKTGKAVSEARGEATRRRHFLKKVTEGSLLQAVTYRLAVQDRPAEGRYVYLKPELEDPWREAGTAGDVEALEAAFRTTIEAVLPAWDAGTFFPRLTDPAGEKEPNRCRYCPVAEACLRHDSGARRRLVEVATRGVGGEALTGLWNLGEN